MEPQHRPVLLEATVNGLIDAQFDKAGRSSGAGLTKAAQTDGVYIDGTFGRGGHSRLLLSQLGPDARLIVFDKDPEAIAVAQDLQAEDARVQFVHDGFSSMVQALAEKGIEQVDGVMLDLGVSSPQLDEAQRGFSFMREGPLDMRMDTSRGMTAAQWLAQADVEQIREVIANYGEERFAFQIAKAIVARREPQPLRTTRELAELVAGVVRTREKGQHPATRTFQALRIHINQEIEELARGLEAALTLLAPGGRLSVISFHSLEDRMVKQCIAAARRRDATQSRLPILEKDLPQPILQPLARVLPDAEEVAGNPRARSAVLRVAERTLEPMPEQGPSAFLPAYEPPGQAARQRRRAG
ncbi:16S rRNA (cytosine(1402)-N(4))-methyltransferase RsmH [Pusillimonas sp. CC-YST705]|uniref:Ribosomal RNA small subunit methyltransferase H n=1 Tax=Mesopusillimonas faecipullorum TaxID=2755040 RepID=A0ABS8C9A3_9BURK|nr:16S rRNA (cytosine(1402)-N(4))-methyltransferase RsmH [Mesopusillimonas faecipullorum]MCB5362611.1 16S rRNA (cytosine(1402)-N(4))-methyltransferase RsmH [Mesopusillimonas faecipullorum]